MVDDIAPMVGKFKHIPQWSKKDRLRINEQEALTAVRKLYGSQTGKVATKAELDALAKQLYLTSYGSTDKF